MSNPDNFDLSLLTFDEFVVFFFDRDIESDEHWACEIPSNWSTAPKPASPAAIVAKMRLLFSHFAAKVSNYSLPQINSGIWAMNMSSIFGPAAVPLGQ